MPGWTTACPDPFGPKATRSPVLPRHEPPAVCRYGSASALEPLRPRDSAPFDFRRRTCCRLPGPKTEESEGVFSWHKIPHRFFSCPARSAPQSRTPNRSPGSPRIRGTGHRSSSTKHAGRNSSRLLVPPLTLPRHGGNETQGWTPAEECGNLALTYGTFPRERGGVSPGVI